MPTPIPKRLRLGWLHYRVVVDRATLRDHEANAVALTESATIVVDDERPHVIIAEHLLHEALHGLIHVHKSDLDRGPRDETEERYVAALAPGILGMLRDNPKLVAFLTAKD